MIGRFGSERSHEPGKFWGPHAIWVDSEATCTSAKCWKASASRSSRARSSVPALSDRVYRVQAPYQGNAVHLYLVRGSKLALIDSGASDSPMAAVSRRCVNWAWSWSDLDYLFNAHGHADHAGGNGDLKDAAPHTQIGIHPADAALLGGPRRPFAKRDGCQRIDAADGPRGHGGGAAKPLCGELSAIQLTWIANSTTATRSTWAVTFVCAWCIRPATPVDQCAFSGKLLGMVFSGDAVAGPRVASGSGAYLSRRGLCPVAGPYRVAGRGHAVHGTHLRLGWGVERSGARAGADIKQTLQASRTASAAIDRAAAQALAQLGPEAPFIELAQAAFRELVFELPILFDRRTIVPPAAAGAIRAHLRAHGWQQATTDAAAHVPL